MSRFYFGGSICLLIGMYIWLSILSQHILADCLPRCFCERLRLDFPRQPINTLSNVCFLLVGWRILRHIPAASALQISYNRAMACCLAVLGTSSGWFHGTFYADAQVADNIGMVLVVMCNIAYLSATASVRPLAVFWTALALSSGGSVGILLVFPDERRHIFTAFCGLLFLMCARVALQHSMKENMHLIRATAAIICSFTVWALDASGVWCFPDSLIQGHSAWHVGCALCVWYMCEYVRVLDSRVVVALLSPSEEEYFSLTVDQA